MPLKCAARHRNENSERYGGGNDRRSSNFAKEVFSLVLRLGDPRFFSSKFDPVSSSFRFNQLRRDLGVIETGHPFFRKKSSLKLLSAKT